MRKALPLALLAAVLPARGATVGPGECAAKFSMSSVLEEAAKPEGRPVEDAMRWELLAYYKWLAFAKGDPAQCAPLKPLRFLIDTAAPPAAGDALCRDLLTRLSFARGYASRSPDLPRLCLADVMSINTAKAPDDALMKSFREACALISRNDLTVEEMCPRAISQLPFPPKVRDKQLRRCVCDFTSMNGAGKCHDDPSNDPAGYIGPYRYDAFNALHGALAAKDPERCGDLELCRGLAGQAGEMAERHRVRAETLRCGAATAEGSSAGPAPAGRR